MIDFKIRRGLSSELFISPGVVNPKLVIEEGHWYLCTDTADLFLGIKADGVLSLKRINSSPLIDIEDASILGAIQSNTNAIEALSTRVNQQDSEILAIANNNRNILNALLGTEEGSIQKTITNAIENLPVATAKKAGVVKTSDEIIVTADGALEISTISVDKLVQGTKTLVLTGGSASTTEVN